MKTKLGISAGLIVAGIYLSFVLNLPLAAVIIAGYVLIAESNEWLRRNALKAIILYFGALIICAIINFIPALIVTLTSMFKTDLQSLIDVSTAQNTLTLSGILYGISGLIDLVMKVLFLILAIMAVKQGSASLGGIDKFVDKSINSDN